MKDSKAVYVTIQDIKGNREYEVYSNRNATDKSHLEDASESNKDFSCQYDCKKETSICTCKKTKRRELRYYSTSRQVYRSQRYSSARGFTDVGVGSIKPLAKKRVRRIYLPETDDRGVGSSVLTPFIRRTWNLANSYYDQKKTSSKCVGGVMEYKNTSVLSKKLSPIYQTKSESTSPKGASVEEINCIENKIATQDPAVNLVNDKETVHIDKTNIQKEDIATLAYETTANAIQTNKTNEISLTTNKIKSTVTPIVNDEKDFSSDSLVQHVHNLENPSSYKQIKTSIDLIENKLEREYRKFFSTKPKECKPSAEVKPMQDFKSASVLRRRFEALRRGLSKKDDSNNDCVVSKMTSQTSVPSKKDVSVASDPPSLEARSYTNTNMFIPTTSHLHQHKNSPQTSYKTSFTRKKGSANWSTDVVDSDYQNVKGMFKLWGKKFNLEEDCYKNTTPNISSDASKKQKKKVELIIPKEEVIEKEKKEVKRFSFFKRRAKDKSKQPYKSKKGVTAGRCEVGDGLTIKIGAANDYPPELSNKKSEETPDDYDNIIRKAWLQRFLANKIDSHNSVQIRWNNDMYATSSSTVFELMECVYKNTGIVFRSKSEMTTGESSYYHSYTKPRVNFMRQNIDAWMIPKIITDIKAGKATNALNTRNEKKKNIEVSFSNQKWFIDKSKALSQKIEVVLHSKNFVKSNKAKSSEYITIDIPKGYFSETSIEDEPRNQTSDEQVYNIVEYDTSNSDSYLKKQKPDCKMDTGDHDLNDIHVTVSVKDSEDNESKILETVIKRPPLYRDVVVQGSNVYLPKRCDVIGVGIITQRDIRDIKKPILKLQDDITDDESTHTIPPQKKCELAESYLQDYYRHWTPLGLDLFSWCVSDSHLRGSSDNNSLNSLNNQGDGSKSCPNIYDDYQASTIVSSCATSSCSHCMAIEEKKMEDSKKTNFFNKFKKKPVEPPVPTTDGKRALPKDSLEVFKRRKIYAASNKSNWGVNYDRSEPYSVPSIEDKGAQNTSTECPKAIKPCCRPAPPKPKKRCKKHVSLQDCDVMNELLNEQLSDKIVEGILSFKGAAGCDTCKKKEPECPRHAHVIPVPICEMPQPPCIDSCTKKRKPPCSKKDSPTCYVPPPPPCPVGTPSPCQPKPCPPSPPPCAIVPPCVRPPPRSPSCSPPRSPPCSPPRSPPCSPPRSPPCSPPRSPPCSLPHSPPCSPPRSPPRSPRSRRAKQQKNSTPPRPISNTSPKLCARRPPCTTPPCARPKPIPPRLHSPRMSAQRLSKPCACVTKKSPCALPQCPSVKKPKCAQEPPPSCKPTAPCKKPPVQKSPSFEKPKKCSQEYPWPLKNQRSNTPSPKHSGMNLRMSPKENPSNSSLSKYTNAFKRLVQKLSNSSIAKKCSNLIPSKSSPKMKECRPDCANKAKVITQPCPPTPPPTAKSRSQPKMTGLHLKKMPMPPNSSDDECKTCCREGLIKLNSKENITIKMKQQTPSTEEIREGCNIKVQDEDGQTLYERRDYRNDKTRTHLVKDMYRDSQIQRLSTSNGAIVVNEKNLDNYGSNTSISNIIEINFNLKFKQGDKTTEVNLKNCGNTPKEIEKETVNTQNSAKEVYLLQDEAKQSVEEADKRDVNIKIVIKSFQQSANKTKRMPKKSTNINADQEFSRKISEKFHTVSTGYSDVLELQTYSVHRTTLSVTNSTEKKKHSEELINEELIEQKPINLTDNESVTQHSAFECSVSLIAMNNAEIEDRKQLPSKTSQIKLTASNIANRTDISTTDNDETLYSDIKESTVKANKITNKEAKKKILKRIFDNPNATKKATNKSKMKSIRQMLRAVLTSDSSAYEDVPVSNELAKELTYASLKPNYFKDSDSMTNYYQHDSSILAHEPSKNDFDEILYPTEQNNSEYSDDSNVNEHGGCLCSHLAAKLNIHENSNIRACCCRGVDKKDEEIDCNLAEDIYAFNKTQHVDVETQDSKHLSSKFNTPIVKIASKTIVGQTQMFNKDQSKITNSSPKKILSGSNNIKKCPKKKKNRQTVLGISDDDRVIFLNSNSEHSQLQIKEMFRNKRVKPIDILQLHETKKAVLEIYAEKTVSDEDHMVAKLPRFVYNKESEICNYQESIAGFHHISRRNIVMMSITR